ncbi:MAG TPA: sulfotransferase [Streptosporangiaceae bacterium]|nr:sulfotransferase [Streptosporangiaceae bacterium]
MAASAAGLNGAAGPGARRSENGDRFHEAAPVIILTYPHAGAEQLTRILSTGRSIACTSATGLLPLCCEALRTWQRIEGRTDVPSQLALRSVRALASTMITVIEANVGASRWCEAAYTTPAMAQAFLRVFPGAQFICLYRNLSGVLDEAVRMYPWGLGDSPFWAYAAGHPGNNAATIAAYWTARTEALLEFEASQPESCLRVRFEDLAAEPGRQVHRILTSLGLSAGHLGAPGEPALTQEPEPGESAGTRGVPAERISRELVARVGELNAILGYGALTPA